MKTPIRRSWLKVGLCVAVAAMFALVGCGGGGGAAAGTGGSGGGGGNTDLAQLSGNVSAPSATLAQGRGPADYVPVPGATVSLKKVEDGSTVGSTTSDEQGNYKFTSGVENNTDYLVEAQANFNGKDIKVKAIVSTGDVSTTPEERDLNPLTTTSAVAALEQYDQAKQLDPNFKPSKLEDVCADMEAREGENFVAPDLSNDEDAAAKAAELLGRNNPDGNYIGRFKGQDDGNLAAIISNGKFMVTVLSDLEVAGIQSVVAKDAQEGDPNVDGGNGDGFEDPSQDGPESPIAFGDIDAKGVLNATTLDGSVTLTGLLVGNVGIGVWTSEKPDGSTHSGTWTIKRKVFTYAGFYGGQVMNEYQEVDGYMFVLITEDKKLLFILRGYSGNNAIGNGTVGDDGTYTFTWRNADGDTGTSTGTITDGVLQGSAEGEFSYFDYDVNLAFDPQALEGDTEG